MLLPGYATPMQAPPLAHAAVGVSDSGAFALRILVLELLVAPAG